MNTLCFLLGLSLFALAFFFGFCLRGMVETWNEIQSLKKEGQGEGPQEEIPKPRHDDSGEFSLLE